MTELNYTDMFPLTDGDTTYRKITSDYVSTVEIDGKVILKVAPEGLRLLAKEAMRDIAHLLRPAHLQQLSNILKDKQASDNDKFVATELLKNANIAAGMVLPGCQDTGTAIVMGKKGQFVWTEGDDGEALTQGVIDTYVGTNLRYSQLAPLSMFDEV
ncbi:MAG: fumarate hydratase, partial [Emcibacter sp.]|nr:fumarate hydratase [Emcibacter sp.]